MTWNPGAGSPNADTLPDLPALRARSRDLARNDMIAAGALGTLTTNVVGTGLKPKPAVDAEALGLDSEAALGWQRDAVRLWSAWTPRADFLGVLDFDELTRLAYRAALESGDALRDPPVRFRCAGLRPAPSGGRGGPRVEPERRAGHGSPSRRRCAGRDGPAAPPTPRVRPSPRRGRAAPSRQEVADCAAHWAGRCAARPPPSAADNGPDRFAGFPISRR